MSNKPITVEEAADAYGLDIKSNSYNFSSERILAEEAFKAGAQWKEQQMQEEKLEKENNRMRDLLTRFQKAFYMGTVDDLQNAVYEAQKIIPWQQS